MANIYKQCYFQLVFAVKHRQALIKPKWKDELEKYITGIIQNNVHKLIAIYAMPDYIHIFIGYDLKQTIPNLVEKIKRSSNHFIKNKNLFKYKFDWQIGYGAFTYVHSQIDAVTKYVLNQKKHHKKKSFKEEYLEFLEKFYVNYKIEYLFDFIDD